MKKREFLAMGGAVPLILAGCGGNSSGDAPVRLVNASFGTYNTSTNAVVYPSLGFRVETTQATSTDVTVGNASPFETVPAGTVSMSLTTSTGGTVANVGTPATRTLSKDLRYTMVAYGDASALKTILITESTVAPLTGNASVNVMNTSTDIGAIDVFLSTTQGVLSPTQVASNWNANPTTASQNGAQGVLAGSYFITVVPTGANPTIAANVLFQSPTAIALVDQQIVTLILTPSVSGGLVNVIVLTQGTSGTVVSFQNLTARVRAVVSTNNSALITVTGTKGSTSVPILSTTAANFSNYVVVSANTAPVVTANGVALASVGTLVAGGDYTLLVYLNSTGQVVSSLLPIDDNTAPSVTTKAKVRLINLVYDTTTGTTLPLSLAVNSTSIALDVAYASASPYTEITVPSVASSIDLRYGATSLLMQSIGLTANSTYTNFALGSASVNVSTGVVTVSNIHNVFESSATAS